MHHGQHPDIFSCLTKCSYAWTMFILMISSGVAHATEVYGRFTFGGFVSKEIFNDDAQGTSNDFMTASGRMYLNIQQWGPFDAVFDLRDTNDFFDRLDAEQLHLTGSNSFQIYEADIRYPNKGGAFYANLGRFSILEAGSAFVDGLEAGERFGKGFRAGAFGGHNPKRPQDIYMRSDTPDIQYGAYLAYQDPAPSWAHFFNTSLAFVNDSVNGFTDREYLFSNVLYQWNPGSRVISNIYLDFVPQTYVQNGLVVYQQGITKTFDTTVTLLAWDTIEYQRQAGILQVLPSSPYHEASIGTRDKLSDQTQWLNEVRYGERLVDNTNFQEAKTGIQKIGVFSPKIEMTGYVGYRQEFVARGPMAYFEANYFSRNYELGFNVDAAIEQRFDDFLGTPTTLTPVTVEINAAYMMSNAWFVTTALQYGHDEIVNIYSAFVTLTYRFGEHNMAPIRDGAAPRRTL